MSGHGSLPLGLGEIHLWLTHYDETTDRLIGGFQAWLSVEERARALRFHFSKDRRQYLLTRALIRQTLSYYEPLLPGEWIFSKSPRGRPHIANPGVEHRGLVFNITHTHCLIALAITRGAAVGVDVENVVAREVSLDVAWGCFAAQEIAVLATLDPKEQRSRFFEYWTLKEAYSKARGLGLALPLDKLSFRYPDRYTVAVTFAPELEQNPARWRFWQMRPSPAYVLALCVQSVDPREPSPLVRVSNLGASVVPTMGSLRWLRTPVRIIPDL